MVGFFFVEVGDCWLVVFGVMDSYFVYVIDDWCVVGGLGSYQIVGDFGLVINYYVFIVGQFVQCDGYLLVVKQKFYFMMYQVFGIYLLCYVCFVQQINGIVFQNFCVDVFQYILWCLMFKDYGMDFGVVQ